MKSINMTDYEKLLFPIANNANEKIIASSALYNSKLSWTSSFYLAVIAQEELAKLIIIPFAKEIDGLDDMLNNKSSIFYSHKIKQKILSSYVYFQRDWAAIEIKKQNCLYSKGQTCYVKPEECYKEIKSAVWMWQNLMLFSKEPIFTEFFKKSLLIITKMQGACLRSNIPELLEDMQRELDNIGANFKSDKEKYFSEWCRLQFRNPYEFIRLLKAVFKDDYKLHLRNILDKTLDEAVEYCTKSAGIISDK